MIQAAVGFHCPDCVRESNRHTRQWSTASPIRVTQFIVGLNVLAHLVVIAVSGNLSLFSGGVTELHRDFALFGPAIDNGEWWRLVSSAFLHYGLFHLGMNMLVLVWMGRLLEPAIGGWRLALLYTAALFGGAFGALWIEPLGLTAGASGAVFGLAGAVVVAERASGVRWQESGLVVFLGLNIVLSFAIDGVSLGGHMGGLILGVLAAAALWGFPRWQAWVRAAATVVPLRYLPEAVIAGLAVLAVALSIFWAAPNSFPDLRAAAAPPAILTPSDEATTTQLREMHRPNDMHEGEPR